MNLISNTFYYIIYFVKRTNKKKTNRGTTAQQAFIDIKRLDRMADHFVQLVANDW